MAIPVPSAAEQRRNNAMHDLFTMTQNLCAWAHILRLLQAELGTGTPRDQQVVQWGEMIAVDSMAEIGETLRRVYDELAALDTDPAFVAQQAA